MTMGDDLHHKLATVTRALGLEQSRVERLKAENDDLRRMLDQCRQGNRDVRLENDQLKERLRAEDERPRYRRWTEHERETIVHLRDHFGLSFGQIGAKMNATADQCRGVYHTPRTRRMTILDACRQAGVATRTFYAKKKALLDARRPASTEDVLAELMEKRR